MVVISDTVVLGGASAFLALIGLALIWSGGRQYRHQRGAVRRAETASGTIESIEIEQVPTRTGTAYVPAVEYEYQTSIQRLRGTTVYPGASRYTKLFGSESAAETAIEGYAPGASTTVYYDPADPEHSFLDPTPHHGPNLARIGFGIALVALGVVLLSTGGIV